MSTGTDAKEQSLKELSLELKDSLSSLVANIDNLVERNPKTEECEQPVSERSDNVFDEIIGTLRSCRGLTREAIDKVQAGIANKIV